MRKILAMAAVAMMTATNLSAQEESVQPYIALDDMPRLLDIMPAPPASTAPRLLTALVASSSRMAQRP